MNLHHPQVPSNMSGIPVEGKVDEYVVLYTPQVRQKQKKWHDGSAKFHHFNNLLVLYDDSNHKIDSTFLGRGRVLEIGEELQIDNHLISLEDLTKTTTRDISGIYTREQNTGLGSNAPPTPRVLQQTILPHVTETTKQLSNVSKRLKLSLATPVKTTTRTTGTLGPTRLVLEQVNEVPFRAPRTATEGAVAQASPPFSQSTTQTRTPLQTTVSHLRNHSSPHTPTQCYTSEDDGKVVETTPVRSPTTSLIRARIQAQPAAAPLVSAAPNPLAPFKRPYQSSARDTFLNTEPAPPIESVMVRARRAGMAPPPNEAELTVREVLTCSAIDIQRRSPSLDDLDDNFPELQDYSELNPEPSHGCTSVNDYPDFDDIEVNVKPEPLSPTFQVKDEPLSPVFVVPRTRNFDADIDILSQLHITIDDSDGDEGMDSFARTTEVIDLVSDEEEEWNTEAGLMSPFKDRHMRSPVVSHFNDRDMSSPILSPVLSPIASRHRYQDNDIMSSPVLSPIQSSSLYPSVSSPNDTTRVDSDKLDSDKVADAQHFSAWSDLGNLDSDEEDGIRKVAPVEEVQTHTLHDSDIESPTKVLDTQSHTTTKATHSQSPTKESATNKSHTQGQAKRHNDSQATTDYKSIGTTSMIKEASDEPQAQPPSKCSSFLDKPFSVPFAKRGSINTASRAASRTTTRQTSTASTPSSKLTISENGPWTKETLELFAWRG